MPHHSYIKFSKILPKKLRMKHKPPKTSELLVIPWASFRKRGLSSRLLLAFHSSKNGPTLAIFIINDNSNRPLPRNLVFPFFLEKKTTKQFALVAPCSYGIDHNLSVCFSLLTGAL